MGLFQKDPWFPRPRRRPVLSYALQGTLTLTDITANDGVGQNGQTGTFHVFDDSATTLVASKSASVDGGNDTVLTDYSFVAGTWYRVYILLGNGKHGAARVQAT